MLKNIAREITRAMEAIINIMHHQQPPNLSKESENHIPSPFSIHLLYHPLGLFVFVSYLSTTTSIISYRSTSILVGWLWQTQSHHPLYDNLSSPSLVLKQDTFRWSLTQIEPSIHPSIRQLTHSPTHRTSRY